MLSKKGCTFFIIFTGREKVEVWNCSDQKSIKYTTKYVLVHKTWRKKNHFCTNKCLRSLCHRVLEIRTNASSYYIMPKYNRVTIILCNQISLLLLLINIYLIFCECPFYQPKINRFLLLSFFKKNHEKWKIVKMWIKLCIEINFDNSHRTNEVQFYRFGHHFWLVWEVQNSDLEDEPKVQEVRGSDLELDRYLHNFSLSL